MYENKHRMKNLTCQTILLAIVVISFYQVDGQKFDLKRVDVELNDRVISGQMIEATQDSMVMIDKNKPAIGCRVLIRYHGSGVTTVGTIKRISDSTLVITAKQAPYEQIIHFRQVKGVKVKIYPSTVDVKNFQRTPISFTQVRSISIRRKGAPVLGLLVGGIAGAAVGYGLAYSSTPSDIFLGPEVYAAGGAVLGFLLGAPIGAAIGFSKQTRPINGDHKKFKELMMKVRLIKVDSPE